jgi:hypothetical protein
MGFNTRTILVAAASLCLLQCGGKSKSQQVHLTVFPKSPIVITGDGKDAHGADVTAPWFEYSLYIENTSDQDVTIVAVRQTITLQEVGAEPTISTFSYSVLNYTIDGTTSVECSYANLGTYPAHSGPTQMNAAETGGNGLCKNPWPVGIMASGLVAPKDKTMKNYRYQVMVEPQGWFGSPTDPQDRFETQKIFFTH